MPSWSNLINRNWTLTPWNHLKPLHLSCSYSSEPPSKTNFGKVVSLTIFIQTSYHPTIFHSLIPSPMVWDSINQHPSFNFFLVLHFSLSSWEIFHTHSQSMFDSSKRLELQRLDFWKSEGWRWHRLIASRVCSGFKFKKYCWRVLIGCCEWHVSWVCVCVCVCVSLGQRVRHESP